MHHIQKNAETAVREMLREIGKKAIEETGQSVIAAEDFMDDGSAIKVNINIDIDKGNSVVDFTLVEIHSCDIPSFSSFKNGILL